MKHKHIFHHPVGVFPAAARWYLAGVASLALLCVAMQLSIQASAQQQAEREIRAWGQQAGVQIGEIRYHLLRNGLILQNILIQRGDDRISIQQLLIKAAPQQITSASAHIGAVDITGMDAAFTAQGPTLWQQDQALRQLWLSSTDIQLHNSSISLYAQAGSPAALTLQDLSLSQKQTSNSRTITASARSGNGSISWQWRINTAPAETAGTLLSSSQLQWQSVNTTELSRAFKLHEIAGITDGEISWHQTATSKGADIEASGNIDLQTRAQQDNKHTMQHLQLTARRTAGLWQTDLQASAWPLAPWAVWLPQINGQKLQAGLFNGRIHFQGRPGSWQLSSSRGSIEQAIYATTHTAIPQGDARADWQAERVNYIGAAINTSSKRLHFDRLELHQADLRLQPLLAQSKSHTPAPPQQSGLDNIPTSSHTTTQAGKAANKMLWNISAESIQIDQLKLTVALPQGEIRLPALSGTAVWPEHQRLTFKLSSAQGDTMANETPAEQWRLRGQIEKTGPHNTATIKIYGQHIPAAQLRPLLDIAADSSRAAAVDGDTELRTTLVVADQQWQMHKGKAVVQAFSLQRGGDSWLAKELRLRFGPVGSGLDTQHISSVEADQWHYIAALQPLPPIASTTESKPTAVPANKQATAIATDNRQHNPTTAPWWAALLRNQQVEIDRVLLRDGQISIGQTSSQWAEQVNITSERLADGSWSDFSANGSLGDGHFHLLGQWNMLSQPPRFRGSATLSDATPFFLHSWMKASGMPRLMRGRISASMQVAELPDSSGYLATVVLQLNQLLPETGVFATDPMLARSGVNTAELLRRIDPDGNGTIKLNFQLRGNWDSQPLQLERIGTALQQQLQQAVISTAHRPVLVSPVSVETRIRLHHGEPLSLNERTRLFKIIRKLRQHKNLVVDMKVEWSGNQITPELHQRIRRTQRLIERYMTYRKIDKQRIYPMVALPADHSDDISAIRIETRVVKAEPKKRRN